MNLKHTIKLIFCSFLFASISSCNEKQKHRTKTTKTTKTDSNKLNDKAIKMKIEDDSLSIVILTTDGEIIKKLKYKSNKLDDERYSNKSSESDYLNNINGYPKADTIVGDFNGDGKKEKAWFKEKDIDEFLDCQEKASKKSCKGTILFSDKTIKSLIIDFCPLYIFKNEGDFYGNGKDAIGVLPGWFSSSCRSYSVFTIKNDSWDLVCAPIGNSMNMREAGITLIERDKRKKGWAIIRESMESYISRFETHNISGEFLKGNNCQVSNVVEQRIRLN